MSVGDLVKLTGGLHKNIGLIIYQHPTKGVAQIYWSDNNLSWASCARLILLASLVD